MRNLNNPMMKVAYVAGAGPFFTFLGCWAVLAHQENAQPAQSTHSTVNDTQFAKKAAQGGMAEVKMGQLAQEKGTSDAVKKFGQRMVDDHSKAGDDLKKAAHWNYYGDHGMEFRDAYVTNCVTSAGQAPSDVPLNKAQVQLLGNVFYQMRRGGVLVDVDPYALNTSQVFAGRFQVSFNLSENQSIPIITADNPTVAYSYFIN